MKDERLKLKTVFNLSSLIFNPLIDDGETYVF